MIQVRPRARSSRSVAARVGPFLEQPVDDRPGARDVGPEGAEGEQLVGERRGGEIVRRQLREIARVTPASAS